MARTEPIYKLVDELPTRSITVRVLKAIDFIAPGEWENLVGFTETIHAVTGETDDALVQKIGERAIALFNDRSEGYRRAMSLYTTVDRVDRLAIGPLAMVNTAGAQIRWLGFLKRFTPKAEPLQGLDLALKTVAELAGFCLINGIPGDSIGDFVKSLGAYSKESAIRMAALVALDGVLPLGPNFLDSVANTLRGTSADDLAQNRLYQNIAKFLPGGSDFSQGRAAASSAAPSKYSPRGGGRAAAAPATSRYGGDTRSHLSFVQDSFGEVRGWMSGLVDRTQMSRTKLADALSGVVEVSDTSLDYVAAFLDMSTNYFEHTGTQTLVRRLVERAVHEI
jgi:hypothetical protein